MLVTAEWVLPIAAPPIRHGGIVIDGDRIAAVGTAADLEAHPLSSEHYDFPGCTLTPGLVNAHTHLTLTGLGGVVGPQPFTDWLGRLVVALKPWDVADHEASGIVGAEQCLLSGVTVVGDIAYGAAEVERAARAGLGGVFYWELLGMSPDEIDAHLEFLRFPADPSAFGPRVVCGLSPHSPYTSGPALLQAVQARARALAVPTAIHIAESTAELELLQHGTGPLSGVASRTALGFEPPGTSTVAYLAALDALAGTTAVHLCHADADDIAALARSVQGAVTCPRSNRYLGNPAPAITPWLESGLAVGVGTDSAASNEDLDLMAEVRALRSAEPDLDSKTLLQIATTMGARAIGVGQSFGSLEPGKFADVSVFDVVDSADPERALIDSGGSHTLSAVMSSGVWRVIDGRLLHSDDSAARRTELARQRSAAAVGDAG